ncbi:uncharacterized protein M8220_000866 isoform 2-T2 [Acridotheres tristis]
MPPGKAARGRLLRPSTWKQEDGMRARDARTPTPHAVALPRSWGNPDTATTQQVCSEDMETLCEWEKLCEKWNSKSQTHCAGSTHDTGYHSSSVPACRLPQNLD